jgi:hypothetical protein
MIVATNLDMADLTEPAGFYDSLACFDQMRGTASLHVYLHDTFVLSGRGKHCLPLNDIGADWFLDINIGPGLNGGDHRQCMPMVGRGNVNDIEPLPLEHFAVVPVSARFPL